MHAYPSENHSVAPYFFSISLTVRI